MNVAGKVQRITKSSYHADWKAVILQMTQLGIFSVGYDAKHQPSPTLAITRQRTISSLLSAVNC